MKSCFPFTSLVLVKINEYDSCKSLVFWVGNWTSFINLIIEVKYNGFLVVKQSAVVAAGIQH